MNNLARLWAEKRLKQLQERELRNLVKEANEAMRSVRPLMREANERRKADMRQDGLDGFVMVTK
jgi:hypothetical protein